MDYTVQMTSGSQDDIDNICRYIRLNFKDEFSADRAYTKVKRAVLSLNYMPSRYRKYEVNGKLSNYHIMPVEKYSVIYTVDDDNKVVHIIRILAGRQNVAAIISDN